MVPVELPESILVIKKLDKKSTSYSSTWEGILKESQAPVMIKVLHEHQSERAQNEIRAYKRLRKSLVTPDVHFLGNFKENWIVVMSKQGPSILELMKKGAFSMTLESISLLAIKVVSLVEKMHSDHILHTNLSPKSILLGRKLNNARLYLIGFKYSVRLLPNTHMEILQESIEDRADTRAVDLFSSVNKCLNILQAKKDDLESILYILLYLIRGGRLSDRLIEKEGRFKSLLEINRWKATTSPDIICENLPSCFAQYLSYIRALGSQDRPNYSYLRSLFSKNFTNKKLGYNLGQLIAYDIVKILATHKSRTVSEANSVCKVTMASEKMLPVVDVEDDLSEDFVAKLPGINAVHSMKEIHWKNNQSELDEEDNEAYNTQSVSSKMEILSQYEAPLQKPLNSAKKISLSYNLAHKVATNKDNKNNDKTNIKETQSKDDTDLAETKRYEDKESLDEFFNKSHSVQFMVRHARPK